MAEAPDLKARPLAERERVALERARVAQREAHDRLVARRAQSARINRERWNRMSPSEYEAALAARRLSGR